MFFLLSRIVISFLVSFELFESEDESFYAFEPTEPSLLLGDSLLPPELYSLRHLYSGIRDSSSRLLCSC